MAPKQRQIKIEQRGGLAAMQDMEHRSDEDLAMEPKHRAAAQAVLGARAADRYEAKKARAHFQRAIAAARPQERMALRRMADASLALAERRPDDLKASLERLGHEAPSGRQMLALRFMGLVAPAEGASLWKRIRGLLAVVLIVVVLLALGFGIVELISLPIGHLGLGEALLLGFLLVIAVIGGLVLFGRRKQARARAAQ
ncbi:MAG: hypothetical protein NTV40_06795 [Solirubrobacterales bacterium]|nr:hypothetical protein [Solirubrobacterales bacterium]